MLSSKWEWKVAKQSLKAELCLFKGSPSHAALPYLCIINPFKSTLAWCCLLPVRCSNERVAGEKPPTRSYRDQMTFQTSSLKGVLLGVVTHLGPDILEWEVKWAFGSITLNKVSGGDEIPAELFQILKDDAVKVLHPTCQQIWKTQQGPQGWKRSVFIPVPKKDNSNECSRFCTVALIS